MAEEIVACPGCGKKFRIPEGAPGGAFQCTACNANVPYGKAAAKPARAAPATRGARAAAGHAPAAGRGRHARRHGHAEPEEEGEEHAGRGRAGRKKGGDQTVLWVSLGVVGLVAVGGVMLAMKKKPAPAPAGPATAPVTAPVEAAPAPVVGTPAVAPVDEPKKPEKPPEDSGIGGQKRVVSPGALLANLDTLFVRVPDVPGVTPQERADMDKDVALFINFDSGRDGNLAGARLKKLGRKAIPPLLSTFEAAWKAKKWEDPMEKWSCDQVQGLLIDIVKADRPGGDFKARYVPQHPETVPATDFQRAARLWSAWWVNGGNSLEKFKDFAE